MIQSGCLLAFLWLFLYACWPYTARPVQVESAPPPEIPIGQVWDGWLPEDVDPESGRMVLIGQSVPRKPIARKTIVDVVDGSESLGAFEVVEVDGDKLTLQPVEPLEPAVLDWLLSSFGPWSLGEIVPIANNSPEKADADWPSHYADELTAKEVVPIEMFLALDPLVSISTALAGKCWVWSLTFAGVILLICTVVPRGFCGYVCPMGTLLDLCDWVIGRGRRRRRTTVRGGWARLKYYVLAATLVASLFGVLISGFVAAIPVITRGMAFLLTPLQMGLARDWHQVPLPGVGHYLSIGLLLFVLALGWLRPRFWCKYVCPTGALFSIGNRLRLTQRKVASSCVECGKCVDVCPFDAIRADFTTRTADCTFCRTCSGVCPSRSIRFVGRWSGGTWRRPDDSPTEKTSPRRRSFLAACLGTMAGMAGIGLMKATGARLADADAIRPVRPPGSVPEREFLQLCIRCGECFQACPNSVLQPVAFEQGLEGLWTPQVVADWSGCEPSCNNCGRVCPTGAIRPLPIDEKRVARIGLAVVDKQTCLPHAGVGACQLCVDECTSAGYDAIEFIQVGTEADDQGMPIPDTGHLAPVVLPDKCVGCGICQTRCHKLLAGANGPLDESAIQVIAGDGNEDRLTTGSYRELRKNEQQAREEQRQQRFGEEDGGYLPDSIE